MPRLYLKWRAYWAMSEIDKYSDSRWTYVFLVARRSFLECCMGVLYEEIIQWFLVVLFSWMNGLNVDLITWSLRVLQLCGLWSSVPAHTFPLLMPCAWNTTKVNTCDTSSFCYIRKVTAWWPKNKRCTKKCCHENILYIDFEFEDWSRNTLLNQMWMVSRNCRWKSRSKMFCITGCFKKYLYLSSRDVPMQYFSFYNNNSCLWCHMYLWLKSKVWSFCCTEGFI